jgi:hypothetical protein
MRNRRYCHSICEDFLRIDVRKLSFAGMGSEWQYHAAPVAVSVDGDSVRIAHGNFGYLVQIVRTRCNYGGLRPWFLCPACGDRRALLYTPPNGCRLGCRRCLRLLYLSECEDEFGRGIQKVRKLERDICKSAGGLVGTAPVADKPRGQHWKTYDRRLEKLERARRAFLWVWARESGFTG